jgi:hypothetical protein
MLKWRAICSNFNELSRSRYRQQALKVGMFKDKFSFAGNLTTFDKLKESAGVFYLSPK